MLFCAQVILLRIDMPPELEILQLVCNRLENAKIPYMLTGSLAAHFYAVPRMTRDIDIVLEIFRFDIERFFRLFQSDFYIVKNSIVEAIEHEGMFNIIHNNSVFKIDFIIRKDSSYRALEFQRKRRLQLGDFQSWVVSPEDLILSKLFWTKDSLSQIQINDVKNLISAIPNLDLEYIDKWVQKLELNHVYEKAKAHGRYKS